MPSQPKPRPVGRPALPKGQAKAAPIQIRLSPDSRQRMEQAAKAKGVTLTDWIRGILEASV
jgi:uncharacterized protein (DUF1778 family)